LIDISRLYCGIAGESDPLRYRAKAKGQRRPVVVWNITRSCNLNCIHCYADAKADSDGIDTEKAKRVIDDLADFNVPVLLFSGGEPVLRKDIAELIYYTAKKGIRAVLSTNGTLIDQDMAKRLKDAGLSYAGISLDGMEEVNDRFRGISGAFKKALSGIQHCKNAGIKVGIRFTISRFNVREVPKMFDLAKDQGVDRLCFYHLVYSGRGSSLIKEDLSHDETRKVVDLIISKTEQLHKMGLNIQVLTVDNHADGPYIYMKMLKEGNSMAEEVLRLLKLNGGNSSGEGIGCISWSGEVHADQFWRHYSFGNVFERPFGEIWTDLSNPLMAKLKQKKRYVKGRCAKCKWLDICAGNFRARAEAVTGDIWAPDPACYLTDEEIGLC
jgi:12,18-didecarboxysiroheme deacetylase